MPNDKNNDVLDIATRIVRKRLEKDILTLMKMNEIVLDDLLDAAGKKAHETIDFIHGKKEK